MRTICSEDESWLRQLHQLRRQLEKRRRQRNRPSRWPEAVWTQAAGLARRLGVSRVSRALGLSYPQLKERTRQLSSEASSAAAPEFIEVTLRPEPTSEASPGYRAEMSDGTGQRLILHLGQDAGAVLELAQSFWRRPR